MKNNIAHKVLNILLLSSLFFVASKPVLIDSKMTKLEYFENIDGEEILNNIDELLINREVESESSFQLKTKSFFKKINNDNTPAVPTKDFFTVDTLPASLNQVWSNTVMIFGVNADGIGIGSAFAVKRNANKAIFVTAFHVMENFCNFPVEYSTQDITDPNLAGKNIACKGVFTLNDLAINTINNKVQLDGKNPWKSKIAEVLYFDKVNDVVVFEIAIPETSKIKEIAVALDYKVSSPKFIPSNLEVKDQQEVSLKKFDIFAVGYPSLYKTVDNIQVHDKGLITKRWSQGHFLGTKSFEGPEQLGLIKAFKHSLYSLPGSSGGPLSLNDGRIVGVNFSKILNSYYQRIAGCSQAKKLVTEEDFFAIPSLNLKNALNK